MAGTITKTSERFVNYGYGPKSMRCKIVTVSWVGDAANGSVPTLALYDLHGFILKVITDPGSTAPTAAYDVKLFHPTYTDLDMFNNDLADRSASTTEEVYPVGVEGATPVFVCAAPGEAHSLSVTGNSVNSATGVIELYLIDG